MLLKMFFIGDLYAAIIIFMVYEMRACSIGVNGKLGIEFKF